MSGVPAPLEPRQAEPKELASASFRACIVEVSTAASTSSRGKILLPVDAIRSLKLQTGDAVLLASEDAKDDSIVVGTVWPSFALEAGSIRLPVAAQIPTGLRCGQVVYILPLQATQSKTSSRRPPMAASIQLSVSTQYSSTLDEIVKLDKSYRQMLAIHTKESLVDLECVHQGQQLSVSFQGNLFHLSISRLMDVNGERGWPVSSSTSPVNQAVLARTTTQVCLVGRTTEVSISTSDPTANRVAEAFGADTAIGIKREDPYAKLGGLDRQIAEIKSLIEMPLMSPEIFIHYGLKPPKGVLLYGPPGTGKTSLARAVATATGSAYLTINGPELSSAFHGETESKLRSIFREARRKSPCIIIIDEIDALAPRREGGMGEGANADGAGEVERRVVAQLLTLLDGMEEAEDEEDDVQQDDSDQSRAGDKDELARNAKDTKDRARVVVLAATNRPNAIDPALRRPGRLDREIEIGIPTASARGEIIRTLVRHVPHELTLEQMDELAGRTHGYVGADLSALVREAGMRAVRRTFARRQSKSDPLEAKIQSMSLEPASDKKAGQSMLDKVTAADLHAAFSLVRPSAMREIFLEPPKVFWSDIAGSSTPSTGGSGALSTKSVQDQVRELVEWPIKHASAFSRLGISPPRGVLLYGPSGCSKTLIARALATESGLNFLAVKGPELYSKYVGESERAVRETFKKARAAAPSIIFFDELDALSNSRDGDSSSGDALNSRIIATLLNEMDGIEAMSDVVVIGATNRPQSLDPALLRPGRLDRLVYVGPPDHEARMQILRSRMAKMAVELDRVDLNKLAQMTEGCSGAEVVSICQEAGLLAMNEDINCQAIEQRHFESAASSVKRRITSLMIRQYETWRDTLVV
ncbi:related to AFG2 - ATPase of the CDC48/PAS1/SEC18 (AAA) family [Melanopsichium pennsylvanicum]|uniref:Related to AFG2 - ATPase of the CDC48/PAS1/SEC18 (AAA) family n=2 Tax=Melanopsichium pennsylvanicum TaxID=63383 RepID=A0AAJ4XQK9_9BASI|nr:related to AFG2-ATPase of the CDC48/PAS1/SEC18 (AAA) family [Melanopsichium pennsylvanicum 4]SNX86111.1 related to AFG2 - ATPase of the CDC48/PAS1/SEC18 (AAA) family [Melanopsichium pennsylvanicum]